MPWEKPDNKRLLPLMFHWLRILDWFCCGADALAFPWRQSRRICL